MGSFSILVALLEQHATKISRMEVEGHRLSLQLCSLEGLVDCCTIVPIPDSDAAGQHALNGSPLEIGEDEWRVKLKVKFKMGGG